tara:strand:- start:897 stop:1127 length:231 start_codon:yes stop_codon:yes gene_type:complete
MKKTLTIILLSFLFYTNIYAAMATCFGGECEFVLSLHYEWAETSCFQTLIMEDVETNFLSFIIEETGEECLVFDSR